MKYPSIFYILMLLAFSCGKDDPTYFEEKIPENCESGKCDFNYSDNSQIQIEVESFGRLGQVVEGENLVFKYLYQYDDQPSIADDELTTELVFEIPGDKNNFTISEEDFVNNKVLYRMICFCGNVSHEFPSCGSITGIRLSPNSWRVNASLTIDYYAELDADFDPIEIEFNTVFARE